MVGLGQTCSTMIEIEDPTTWPKDVVKWAESFNGLRGSTEHPGDLGVHLDRENEFRALLTGHKVLAFHCTRLLEHEAAGIRGQGLRLLTADLLEDRIGQAYASGDLDAEQRRRLSDGHAFARKDSYGVEQRASREGQCCFVLGRTAFDDNPSGCAPLLSSWGGEAIYRMGVGELTLGRPSLVVAGIPLDIPLRGLYTAPSLGQAFVAAAFGMRPQADIHLRVAIPSVDIVDIWSPGHPEYDLHAALPRV